MHPEIHRIHLSETDSTNHRAKSLLLQQEALGAQKEILLVTTDYQTAGRGQRGNSWEAERGKNLLFSLTVCPTHTPASQQFVLCELISVALCEVLSRYTDGIRIKWPNDIYHRDHKLSGILIEHDIEGTYIARTIIGIGLNVNQAYFASDAPTPYRSARFSGTRLTARHCSSRYATHSPHATKRCSPPLTVPRGLVRCTSTTPPYSTASALPRYTAMPKAPSMPSSATWSPTAASASKMSRVHCAATYLRRLNIFSPIGKSII